MRLISIQTGKPRTLPPPEYELGKAQVRSTAWSTGYGKSICSGPVQLGFTNLEGDGQADQRHHGGAQMAVLAYAAAHYPAWRSELSLPELPYGAFAENLTIEGADESTVCLGDSWQVGSAQLQISQPRKPCINISKFWNRADLLERVVDTGRFGWYLRVLQTGVIEAGNEIALLARPHPRWTIERCMQARLAMSKDPAAAAELAALPELGEDWRSRLVKS